MRRNPRRVNHLYFLSSGQYDRADERSGTISQSQPAMPSKPDVEERAQPLVVKDWGRSAGWLLNPGLSRARLAQERSVHPLDESWLEIGATADEVRIGCEMRCDAINPSDPRGKGGVLQGGDRSGRDELMTIDIGIAGATEGGCQLDEATAARRLRSRAPGKPVRDLLTSRPMRINDVGAHQRGDRDFARASPSGKTIAKRTPSAIG